MLLKELFRFFRYALVGLLSLAVHMGVSYLCFWGFSCPIILSNSLGFLSAILASYFGHQLLTFQASDTLQGRVKFALLLLFNFLLTNVALVFLVSVAGLPDDWALFISILIIPVSNYLIMRIWIFPENKQVIRSE